MIMSMHSSRTVLFDVNVATLTVSVVGVGGAATTGAADAAAVERGIPPSPAWALLSSMPFLTPAHTVHATHEPSGITTKNTIKARSTDAKVLSPFFGGGPCGG